MTATGSCTSAASWLSPHWDASRVFMEMWLDGMCRLENRRAMLTVTLSPRSPAPMVNGPIGPVLLCRVVKRRD